MSSSTTWRSLPLQESNAVPRLLVSSDIGTADYTVRLSDMANIWVENLDRKAICMRGWDQNTSIDPSDTPENMATFLDCLRSALDATHNQHNRTSLSLSSNSDDADGLILKFTCSLPGLSTLNWPIFLKKSPPSTIATELVFPLVEAHYTRKRQVDFLIQALVSKDAALAKVLDKLEATGTGLDNVFTALSGRKKVSRSAAETRVKGLAVFDESRWQSELDAGDDGPDNIKGLTDAVFGSPGLQCRSSLAVEASPALDTWWRSFKGTLQTPHAPPTATSSISKAEPSTSDVKADGDDDDFQVQATPPHLASSRKALHDDESTEDDEDDLSHSNVTEQRDTRSAGDAPDHRKTGSRLGTIGGKKQPLPAPHETPEKGAAATEKQPAGGHESETASEASDSDADTKPSKEGADPSASLSSPKSKPTAKMGVIGRIGKTVPTQHSAQEDQNTPTNKAAESTSPKPVPERKKLGAISGKTNNQSGSAESAPKQDHKRGRKADREPDEATERETSQERADRKRDELKKELERKAAAGPTRKKRRF